MVTEDGVVAATMAMEIMADGGVEAGAIPVIREIRGIQGIREAQEGQEGQAGRVIQAVQAVMAEVVVLAEQEVDAATLRKMLR